MAHFTIMEMRNLARSRLGTKTARSVLEAQVFVPGQIYDVFLSHSRLDAELIYGVREVLHRQGKSVYVDWIDDARLSRDRVTAQTAAVLRSRMRASHSLIYVATSNSVDSRWMPWELGYFDGFRPGKVAIFPLTEQPEEPFAGVEYLGIYPVVERNDLRTPVPGVRDRRTGIAASLTAFASPARTVIG